MVAIKRNSKNKWKAKITPFEFNQIYNKNLHFFVDSSRHTNKFDLDTSYTIENPAYASHKMVIRLG